MNEMPTGRPNAWPAGTVMLGYPATAAGVELAPRKWSPLIEIRGPRRAAGRRDDRVEAVLLQHGVDPERASTRPARRRASRCRPGSVSGPFLSAMTKISWPKYGISRSFSRLLNAIRSDERLHLRGGSEPGQVFVQSGLELVEQHLELAVVQLRRGRNVGGIDDDGAVRLHDADCGLDQPVGGRAVSEVALPRHADARALQRVRVERLRVVARVLRRSPAVAASRGSSRPFRSRSAAASATVRAIGPAVSCVREIGMMPARLIKPDRRLDADESGDRRRDTRSSRRFRCRRRPPQGSRRPRLRCRSSTRTGCGRARTGSCTCPPRPLQPLVDLVDRKFAHSLRFVLPRITAPASRRRSTTNASRAATEPSSASDPAVVVIRSAVSMLSLMTTGMPCSGHAGPSPCAPRPARQQSPARRDWSR